MQDSENTKKEILSELVKVRKQLTLSDKSDLFDNNLFENNIKPLITDIFFQDIIARFDREGRHTFTGDSIAKLLRRTPDFIYGKTHDELGFPVESSKALLQVIKKVFEEKRPQRVKFYLNPEILIDCYCIPETTANDKVNSAFISISSINEIRTTNIGPAEITALFHDFTKHCNSAVFFLEHGKITEINNKLELISGWSESELSAGRPEDLFLKDFSLSDELSPRVLKPNEVASPAELILHTKSGDSKWVECYTAKVNFHFTSGLLVTLNDITRKKIAESILRKTESKYRLLAENVNDVLWTMDIETLTFGYVSPSVERMRGFKPSDIAGRELREQMPEEYYSLYLKTLNNELIREKSWDSDPLRIISIEIELYHENGSKIWTEESISFIRNRSGLITGILSVSRDITKRKMVELEQKNLEFQLRQAQKMEAIGTLAGGIAHDFNNILTSIIGYTELSLNEAPEESQIPRRLGRVLKACNRAKEVIGQVLTFSHMSKQAYETVRLDNIVREAMKLIRVSLPTTIKIKQQIESGAGYAVADPTQIHQILINLCTNAAHAMKEDGGLLSISLQNEFFDDSKAKNFIGITPGPYLLLSIKDTGHGMDENTIARIFDPFFTTKSQGEGTGMGLSLVHGIMQNHGGIIDVKSEPNAGTEFRLFFPETRTEKKVLKRSEKSPEYGKERILFVDDEEFIADMTCEIIQSIGYKVVSKTSSLDALNCFRKNPENFDLIITDQTMPDMTGYNLAKKIREIRKDIPIIICSGYSGFNEMQDPDNIGISEYVIKPFELRNLSSAIRRSIDK